MNVSIPVTNFRLSHSYGFEGQLELDTISSNNFVTSLTTKRNESDAIFLGKLAEVQRMQNNVWLDTFGAHAIYIMGKRRSGKSHTLGVIAEGLVANSWLKVGSQSQAVLLLDTMN